MQNRPKNMLIKSGFTAVNMPPILQSDYHVSSYSREVMLMNVISVNSKYQVFQDAFCNTFKMFKFMEEYSNLLQEYISPEDYDEAMKHFHERTEQYTRTPCMMSDEEIAWKAKLLLSSIEGELDSSEIADILNVDVFDVESALEKYSKNKGRY